MGVHLLDHEEEKKTIHNGEWSIVDVDSKCHMTGLSQISDKLVSPQVNQHILSHPADTPLLLDTRRAHNTDTTGLEIL